MWDSKAKNRAKTHRDIILNMLREAGHKGVTNTKLKEVTFRFGMAIHTLYMLGYTITTEDLERGICRYTLIKEPKVELEINKERAVDILAREIDNLSPSGINGDRLIEIIKELGFDVKRKKGYYAKNNGGI